MKIGTTVTRKEHLQVEISPAQAIKALKDEITDRINKELESLKLPPEELRIPSGGFDSFYVDKDDIMHGRHTEGRHPRETETDVEIKWGVERFKRALVHSDRLQKLHNEGFLA